MPTDQQALIVADNSIETSLVKAASALGMGTDKLARRLERADLSVAEKAIFLTLAPDLHLLPESFEKLLTAYRGDIKITPEFLERRVIGQNLVSNRFGDLADYIEQAIEIRHLFHVPISYADLGMLLMEYGPGTIDLLETVESSLDQFVDLFEIRKASEHVQIAKCISFICKVIIPECTQRGRVVPQTMEDFKAYGRSVRERTERQVGASPWASQLAD